MATSADYQSLRKAWERATEEMFQAMPSDYSGLSCALRDLHYSFREAIARRLAPALNSELCDMRYYSYADKKAIASRANQEAAQFGLAILCPTSNYHSILVAERGNRHRESRFSFQHPSADSLTGYVRVGDSVVLPPLRLVPTTIESPELSTWEALATGRKDNERHR